MSKSTFGRLLIDCDQVLIEQQPSNDWGVDRVPIKMSTKGINQGYRFADDISAHDLRYRNLGTYFLMEDATFLRYHYSPRLKSVRGFTV